MTRWTRQPASVFRDVRLTVQSSPVAMPALVIRAGQVMIKIMLVIIMIMTMMMMIGMMPSDFILNLKTPNPGKDCSIRLCNLNCGEHGSCQNGACVCEQGWTGQLCQSKECDPR